MSGLGPNGPHLRPEELVGALHDREPAAMTSRDHETLAALLVTVATIREQAERTVELTGTAARDTHAGGRRAEARDVLAILDMNGRPPGEPVILTAGDSE
jgi:hypothetical protein